MEEFNRNVDFLTNEDIVKTDEEIFESKNFCKSFLIDNAVEDLAYIIGTVLNNEEEIFELLKTVPRNFVEPHAQSLLNLFCSEQHPRKSKFIKFMFENFENSLQIPNSYLICDDIEIIKLIMSFKEINEQEISEILASSVFMSCTDVFDFILDNFKINEEYFRKDLNNKLSSKIFRKDVSRFDIFHRVLTKFPNIFDSFKNWSISSDFSSCRLLVKYYFGNKIDPLVFSNIPKYLLRKKDQLKLNEYVSIKWRTFNWRNKEYDFIRITMINDEYYPTIEQIENIIRIKQRRRLAIVFAHRIYGTPRNVSELQRRNVEPFFNRYPEDRREEFFNSLLIG